MIHLPKISFTFTAAGFLILSGCAMLSQRRPATAPEQYVVMLSMDGCRWDYPQLAHMSNLAAIAKRGVKAESLQPSFPANTFPNHYSMATGLYPDHHGIVDNSFYAPELGGGFSLGNRDAVENGEFYGGEPIWVTAEKQSVRAASFFWAGSAAAIQGIRPSIWKRYDGSVSFEARVDSVVSWLQLPEERRPRLITWYFDQPDGSGHDYGPESAETVEMLQYLDSLVGDFTAKVEQLPIADQVNIIVTSDHGMAATSEDRVIFLDDYLNYAWLDTSISAMYDPREGYEDSVYLALKKAPHYYAWKKDSIPERFHYGTHERIMDIVTLRDINWSAARRRTDRLERYNGGSHGYDPQDMQMHAIFYAMGPAFKAGYLHPSFENVHLYSLIAHILNLDPAPTDGSLDMVSDMLKPGFKP
jgi:alkaline phosphatase D